MKVSVVVFAAGVSLKRCSVFPALGALIPPAILHCMLQGLTNKTVSRKVLDRFGISLAFAFASSLLFSLFLRIKLAKLS